jgi:polysaccharide biosynthesis transport protein
MNAVARRPLRSTLTSYRRPYQLEAGEASEPLIEPSLCEYWRIIKKHRWLILLILTVTLASVGTLTVFMTRIYTAETVLLIDPRPQQVVDIKQVISEPQRPENDLFVTQYEMLRSRSLISEVIRREGLMEHPFYREEFQTRETTAEPITPKAINIYTDHMLKVSALRNSRLVKIEISTADPELSARLANSHAQAFIGQGLNITARASQDAIEFLSGKLEQLKGRVRTAETALNAFRKENGIVSVGEKDNITLERLADLNKRLTDAEVERIAAEAQILLVRKGAYDAVPMVLNNPLVQTLKSQQSKLEVEYANLNTQLTPEHPQMIQLSAQLTETRTRINNEMRRVIESLESSVRSAQAKEQRLRDAMERQKTDTLELKDAAVEYAVLAREVDSNRQLYDSVLQRLKDLGVAAELRASNIFVIDKALPPTKPSKPNLFLYLGTSGFLGLLGGLGAAFLREYLNNTLRTPNDVEQYLHLPNLAVVPAFPKPAQDIPSTGRPGQLTTVARPHSAVAEAYSMLHTSIRFSRPDDSPKTILFTSGVQGEGKTVTAVNTAIICARMGSRVVLIDADLRAPRCHEVIGVHKAPGLTEAITGQLDLKRVIQTTSVEFLDFIPSGGTPPTPPALLGSSKMHEIISCLRNQYDFVIVDSPPVMPVTDAVVLSTVMEGVILVVDSQHTPNHIVQEAYTRLHYANARMLGVVLNRVDIAATEYAYYSPAYQM